ncbi:hypothetical protein [Oceanirhabdus seepicola]|uniref:Uncharacterized protein n=1 Tax=Oceanirhabdus seepicola TaxID=2828781 RepID=A0A9J6P7G7_9CLOT|nr:hypothetical protein [Oceanirhabdus seepicola]MCM1991456.1 hypothetical protein [Oceanirhabdus seepicola]
MENFQNRIGIVGKSCGKVSKKSDNSHKWCGQNVGMSNMYKFRGDHSFSS